MLANVGVIREDAPMDYAREGLLDGLQGEERAQREKLLTRLLDDGFTEEDLRRAVKENRLALLPVDRVLGGTYTATEIEERSGLPASNVIRIRRILGLPQPEPEDRVTPLQQLRRTELHLVDAALQERSAHEVPEQWMGAVRA